ncbi:MAG TPA: MauE/DoxX family redox-associated membrane protein [Actinophytocola sp.]|uniref:MauE/DoxX family redox-associated membrane protein n=1 Tax=Actinophytocola sp. TaxID=1872138 RepID=UPI002DB9498C|nr:MauE/DoxX family redox-associated membrane protein [Actinophytocola sp.]HEU5470943.1 MauE/DoxX family redox-associated membrane protein [Actinophytocola sp.]
MHYLDVAARFLIGTVFLVAVVGKISSRAAFAAFEGSLRRMAVLVPGAVGPAARATLALEALTVVLLIVPLRWAAVAGFAIAGGLLAIFTVAIARSLRAGNRAPCRCFGASSVPLGPRHLVRNGLLLAGAAVGLVAAGVPGEVDLAGALAAAVAGLAAGGLIAGFDDIAELVRPVH